MKGKKIDNSFVSSFIMDSCQNGKSTISEIVEDAHSQINEIDRKIIEVEKLKKIRSKLLDVIITFDKNKISIPTLDENLIKFYRIQDKKIAKQICSNIFNYSNVDEVKSVFSSDNECFCLKQLLEFEILYRADNIIKAGKLFPAFSSFLKNYEFNR